MNQELLGDNQHIVIDYVRQSCFCCLGNLFPFRFGFEIIYQRRGNGQIPAVAAEEWESGGEMTQSWFDMTEFKLRYVLPHFFFLLWDLRWVVPGVAIGFLGSSRIKA